MIANEAMVVQIAIVMVVRMDHRPYGLFDTALRTVRVRGHQPAMRKREQGREQ
jgi:hypothetical protein